MKSVATTRTTKPTLRYLFFFFVGLLIENEENKEEKMPEELDEMVLKSDRVSRKPFRSVLLAMEK